MLHLYIDMFEEDTVLWERILNHLRSSVLNKDTELYLKLVEIRDNFEDYVWLDMKKSKDLPHIGKVYSSVIAKTLKDTLQKLYPDFSITLDVNNSDFYIGDKEITSMSTFMNFLNSNKYETSYE